MLTNMTWKVIIYWCYFCILVEYSNMPFHMKKKYYTIWFYSNSWIRIFISQSLKSLLNNLSGQVNCSWRRTAKKFGFLVYIIIYQEHRDQLLCVSQELEEKWHSLPSVFFWSFFYSVCFKWMLVFAAFFFVFQMAGKEKIKIDYHMNASIDY